MRVHKFRCKECKKLFRKKDMIVCIRLCKFCSEEENIQASIEACELGLKQLAEDRDKSAIERTTE